MPNCRRAWSALVVLLGATNSCRTPPVRPPEPPAAAWRAVRLERSLSITGITHVLEIWQATPSDAARGAVYVTTGGVNRRVVEQEFGCRARAYARVAGYYICLVRFRPVAPDWAATLRRLDNLGIASPPRGSGAPRNICHDGAEWALTARRGSEPVVHDRQSCGRPSPERAVYEAGIDSLFQRAVAAGLAR
jgi:hypothetical protein